MDKGIKNFLIEEIEGVGNKFRIVNELYERVRETNNLIFDGKNLVGDQKMIDTYFKLRKEESSEFFEALVKRDKVELLDAVIDTLVVTSFEVYLRDKPLYTPQENIYMAIDLYPLCGLLETVWDREEMAVETLQITQAIFMKMHINHKEAVDTVIKSNYSKFPTAQELHLKHQHCLEFDLSVKNVKTFDEFIESYYVELECKKIEDAGRYSGIFVKKVVDSEGQERLTFWCTHDKGEEKLKYVKPSTFIEPNFKKCFDI